MTNKPNRLVLAVDRDGWTNGLQLQIASLDENGHGSGYRLAGPKYNGSGKRLLEEELSARDVTEIRKFLDKAYPKSDAASGNQTRRVLTPSEYNAAWHAVEGAAGEPGADPGTVLLAVLNALGIQPPTA
ncbi:hypothetical protein [Streptomyces asiaticus]|uniref:hypothetical protein n=1 Tax=Streptomyces asiaticus TaxID=114695 RepID=UPI00381BF597